MRLRSSRRNQIQERIGLELRALYGEVLCEPLPDRFRELLGRLAPATASSPTARQGAPFPSTSRADRKTPRLPSRQRRPKVNCSEPGE
jgi:hypothetical protein